LGIGFLDIGSDIPGHTKKIPCKALKMEGQIENTTEIQVLPTKKRKQEKRNSQKTKKAEQEKPIPVCDSKLLHERFPEIAKQWHYEKNKGTDLKTVARASGKKYFWSCTENPEHVYLASVQKRTKGRDCPDPECIAKKKRKTCLERYGCEHHMQNSEIKEKIKEIFVERYGCEHPMQNSEIKEKTKETCIERYGYECSLQIPDVKKKIRKTFLERHGCEYSMQNSEINKKIKKTLSERYGCEHPTQSPEIRGKIKATFLERYGYENPLQNSEVKEKSKKTFLERYGCEYPSQNPEIKMKIKETCVERYGCEYPMQNSEVKEKFKETCLERYGCEYPTQNPEIKEKSKETCVERYGCDNPMQNSEVKEKFKETCLERYGCGYPMQNPETKEKTKETWLKHYGCEHPMQNPIILEKSQKMAFKLKSFVFPSGRETKVQGYEPFALDHLLKSSIPEDDIVVGCANMPVIYYTDVLGKQRRYFPDIFLPLERQLIEVKSTWTMKQKPENIQLKLEAARREGFRIKLWVFDEKGILLEELENVHESQGSHQKTV
jgi:hypothetical protein